MSKEIKLNLLTFDFYFSDTGNIFYLSTRTHTRTHIHTHTHTQTHENIALKICLSYHSSKTVSFQDFSEQFDPLRERERERELTK